MSAGKVKTTVLMPTLARRDWDRYLPTIFDQTTTPDEVIIVVDRNTSDQEKRELEERWPGVNFLFNKRNIGITASLNRGLEAASGAIIFRADDDDFYREDRLERQLRCFAETEADFVASWAKGSLHNDGSKSFLISCPQNDTKIKRQLLKRNILVHSSLAFRADTVRLLGGYDEAFLYSQDYALYFSAIRAGKKFAVVPETLIHRIYGSSNISVKDRYRQLMFSCAASINHHAHTGTRNKFLTTLFRYAFLAVVPQRARDWRRLFFSSIGKGV